MRTFIKILGFGFAIAAILPSFSQSIEPESRKADSLGFLKIEPLKDFAAKRNHNAAFSSNQRLRLTVCWNKKDPLIEELLPLGRSIEVLWKAKSEEKQSESPEPLSRPIEPETIPGETAEMEANLADFSANPAQILVKIDLKKPDFGKIDPNSGFTCWDTIQRLPKKLPSASYEIVELDWKLRSGRFISLRNRFSDFQSLPDLKITGLEFPIFPPILEAIVPQSEKVGSLHSAGGYSWASASFLIKKKNLNPNIYVRNLKIFFKVFLDQNWVDIIEAKCSRRIAQNYFCKIEDSRAVPDLRPRVLKFELDSVFFTDSLGREIEWSDPAQLDLLSGGDRLEFERRFKKR